MKTKLRVGIATLLVLQSSWGEEITHWPPKDTAAVRAFSFTGGPNDLITDGDKVHPTARPHGGLLLTKEQAASACAALNTTSNHFGYSSFCFEPRDALAFFDADGAALASVSICFTCYDSRVVPNSLAAFDYAALAQFFAKLDLGGGYSFNNASASDYAAAYRKKVEEWRARRAKAAGRPIEPEPWKLAEPSAAIQLSAGDQVFIASNIPYDPFDGLKSIDSEGCVRLDLIEVSVMIGGLTEVEASEAVRTAAIEANLYNDHPSLSVSVVSALRFAAPISGSAQQGGAGQAATGEESAPE